MTALANSRTAAAAAALLFACAGVAHAQDGTAAASEPRSLTEQLLDPNATPLRAPGSGPRSLRPPGSMDDYVPLTEEGRAVPLFPTAAPVAASAGPSARSLSARPGEEGTGIEVGRLSGLAAEGIGTLGPGTGGLPRNLWSNSNRLHIEDALASLPDGGMSPSAGSLLRRVLLSEGDLPQGASSGTPIVGLRLEQLYDAGFAADAAKLAQLVPAGEREAVVAAWLARANLALGNTDAACEALPQLPAAGDPAADPSARLALELAALCQARGGQQVAALLTVDLAREQGVSDAGFIALATRAAGGPDLTVPKDGTFTGLHYALARQAGVALPKNVVERAEPALLATLATDGEVDWPQRLAAAEQASSRGILNARALADIYHRANVEKAADGNPRAKAFAATLDETDPAARVTIVNHAFVATPVEMWPGTLPAFASSLRAVNPSVALADHAVFMAEALTLIGDPMRADAWVSVAVTSRPEMVTRLEALLRIANANYPAPWDPGLARRAVDVRVVDGGPKAAGLIAAEMRALEGLGYAMEPDMWTAFEGAEMTGRDLDEAVLRQLRAAGANQRMGEAALVALIALNGEGPWVLSPSSLGAVVEALHKAGLDDDARELAAEALVIRAHRG